MIVWGGLVGGSTLTRLNTGGRYTISGGLTISPTSQSFPASGGSNGAITVTSTSSCSWTAVSNASWLTINTAGTGSGNGAVTFTVAPNLTTSTRTGTITVIDQIFTVTQAGAPPTNIGVSLATTLAAATGTNLTVPIMVEDLSGKAVVAYDFVLTFDPTVLQLQSPPVDVTGTLSSGFSVTPNATPLGRLTVSAFGTTPLTGAGTLLKLNFTVVGAAGATTPLRWQSFRFNEGTPTATTTNGLFTVNNPPPSLTSLSPNTAPASSGGFPLTVNGTGFVNSTVVRWNGSDRATTFVSSAQLTALILTSDLANAGTANVTAFNPAPGGGVSNALPFTITACNYAIAPTAMSFSSDSGNGSVAVTTGATCPWTATTNAAWITLSAGSGTGSGALSYTVAPNTAGPRTGTITLAGQTVTVTQAGALGCVNGASYKPNAPLAPDSIVAAFGQELSTSDTGQGAPPGGSLPTDINGTTVKVTDSGNVERLAPLFFVSKTQVNLLMPTGTAVGAALVTITNGAGVASTSTVQIAMVAPGIFSANANGAGPVVGSAVRVSGGTIIAEEPLARYDATLQRYVGVPLEVGNPNERVVIQIYGTGLRKRSSLANVMVTIGGVPVTVEYAGAQPGFVGLDQLNIVVPPVLAGRGEVDILVVVDGQMANVVTLTIK